MLFTTYLGHLTRMGVFPRVRMGLEKMGLKNPKVYYVMRRRGNDAVAPSDRLFNLWMQNQRGKPFSMKFWKKYKRTYLKQLEGEDARTWMKKVAEESVAHDVVLVCYEKDGLHCHRALLAQTMAEVYGANYVGELREFRRC